MWCAIDSVADRKRTKFQQCSYIKTTALKVNTQGFAMQRVILCLCMVLLGGCANIVNTHSRNAVPLDYGSVRSNIGLTYSSNVYKLHDYTPALSDR
jgi:hypothetical protein